MKMDSREVKEDLGPGRGLGVEREHDLNEIKNYLKKNILEYQIVQHPCGWPVVGGQRKQRSNRQPESKKKLEAQKE